MSGNYTLDSLFISKFSTLNITIGDFSMSFAYYPNNSDVINPKTDCINNADNSYCFPPYANVAGIQKLRNNFVILNYLKEQPHASPFANFSSKLLQLYGACKYDYTYTCINSIFSNPINTTVELSTSTPYGYMAPFYYLNNYLFFWPNFIDISYCLALNTVSNNCPECNTGCSYFEIDNMSCKPACNVSTCGYGNLECINHNGCYNFMIEDGTCDKLCTINNECKNSDVCAPGCMYSNMTNGLCPYQCTGICFQNCSSAYCSPGCLFSDLSKGICSSYCSDYCSSLCNNTANSAVCSTGCLYSYMTQGLCPASCTDSCFSHCSKKFCSPGCLYSDLVLGICDYSCTESCLFICNKTEFCSPGCSFYNLNLGLCYNCPYNCLSYCNINNTINDCSPGCTFDGMKKGLCPSNCTNDCFLSCSSDYCSPGCPSSAASQENCSLFCPSHCCNSNKNGKSVILYYILVPIFVGILL